MNVKPILFNTETVCVALENAIKLCNVLDSLEMYRSDENAPY